MNTHPHPYHPSLVLRVKDSTRYGATGDLIMPKRVMPHVGGGATIICHAFSITAPDSPSCRNYEYTVDGGKTWHPAHEAPETSLEVFAEREPGQKPEMSEGERKARSERWKSAVEAYRIFAQSTVGALRIVTTRDVFSDPAANYVVDWFAPAFTAACVSLELHREGIENGDYIVVHKPDLTPAKTTPTPEHRLGAAFREVCKLRDGSARQVEFRNQTNPCHWAVAVATSFDSAVEHLAQASEGIMSGRITVNAITHP